MNDVSPSHPQRWSASLWFSTDRAWVGLGVALLIGLGVRLALAFIPGYAPDVSRWEFFARNVLEGGLPHIYAPTVQNPRLGIYPPLYHYALGLVGLIYQRFFSPDFILGTPALNVLMKLAPSLGECLMAWGAYVWVRRVKNARMGLWSALAVLFNPALIYTSAYWGMFGDALYALCVVAALFAAYEDQVGLAWAAVVMGALVKPQGVIFIPLIAWTTLRPLTLNRCLQAGVAGGLTAAAIWAPFIWGGTVHEAVGVLRQTVGLYPYLSANAHNLWYLVSVGGSGTWGACWRSDVTPIWGRLDARALGLAAFGLAYLLALSRLKTRDERLFPLAAYLGFAFYMLNTQMHENYLYPAVALLAIIGWRSRSLTVLALALTFTALANMVLHDQLLNPNDWLSDATMVKLTLFNSGLNALAFGLWTGALLFSLAQEGRLFWRAHRA